MRAHVEGSPQRRHQARSGPALRFGFVKRETLGKGETDSGKCKNTKNTQANHVKLQMQLVQTLMSNTWSESDEGK